MPCPHHACRRLHAKDAAGDKPSSVPERLTRGSYADRTALGRQGAERRRARESCRLDRPCGRGVAFAAGACRAFQAGSPALLKPGR